MVDGEEGDVLMEGRVELHEEGSAASHAILDVGHVLQGEEEQAPALRQRDDHGHDAHEHLSSGVTKPLLVAVRSPRSAWRPCDEAIRFLQGGEAALCP